MIGDEVIEDFNREEGDRIEVVGHTVDVYKVVHEDTNDDGIPDSTVMHIQSNQGNNGGAHNKDKLGTIRVFGDLVMRSDYTTKQTNYGIVRSISELGEAVTPRVSTQVNGTPPPFPSVEAGELPSGALFGVLEELNFDGKSHIEIEHDEVFELEQGTFALRFTSSDVGMKQGLFSKDYTGNRGGGDVTAYIEHGRVIVRMQSTTDSIYVQTPEGSLQPGQEYHVAVTFGPDGLWLYLDGEIMAAKSKFKQNLLNNTQNMAIGANTWSRNEEHPYATWNRFVGSISDFLLFGSQFNDIQVAELSGYAAEPQPTEPYVEEGWLFGTDADEQLIAADYNVTNVHGGYGDDDVSGTDNNDVLYGGHGEDRVDGGKGNDIIYSFSDGREPPIAQRYGLEDDPYNEIDEQTRTYYPYQPIEADDVFRGGEGADTFHFRVLINAKRHIILKHVRSDGTINWNGVAGENNLVHDHWVDAIGNEVIEDFNRDEGDRIEVVGHTVDVYKVVHEDSDGDGILDSTVMYIQSNQGKNGGAHNKDKLGTIRVFGDLVMRSDYTTKQTNYGIVRSISELGEAVTPRVSTSVVDDGTPPPFPIVDDGELPSGAVFGVCLLHEVEFDGESHIEVYHEPVFELEEGTFALNFVADDVGRKQGLFSKDYSGNREGGDFTAFIEHGRVKVRLQSATDSVWIQSPEGSILPGQEYHVAVTFGSNGLWLYLNGEIMAVNLEFTQNLVKNTQHMAIGANTWSRNDDRPYATWDHFVGSISKFLVFDAQYNHDQIAELAGGQSVPGNDNPTNDDPVNDDPANDDPVNDDPVNDDPVDDDPNIELPMLGVQDVHVKATNIVSVPVALSHSATGLSGFDIKVSISDEAIATITGVEVGDEFFGFTPDDENPSGASVRVSGVDLNDVIGEGNVNVALVRVEFQALAQGTANIDLDVIRLDDDAGIPIDLEVKSGTLSVHIECPALAGEDSNAQDLNADGRCEDANGNGYVDFNDVVALFERMNEQEVQDNPGSFDFNGNDRVEMADIIRLFEIIVLGQ